MTPQEIAIEEAAKLQQDLDKKSRGKLAFDRFIAGAKSDTAKSFWFAKFQQEQDRKYNEEDLREAFKQSRQAKIFEKNMPPVYESFEEWFEQFKNNKLTQ
jgi:hypothetical protein